MTEKQKCKVRDAAFAIFSALNKGYIVRDVDGNIVAGLRYGCHNNPSSWSYLFYNIKKHLVSKPIFYCDIKNTEVCKKFYIDTGARRAIVVK